MNINPFDVFKNAHKIQEQMSGFQEKLGLFTVTGAAAAGLVEIDLNGKMEVLSVRIAPQAMDDTEMLQDLVMAAFTDAMAKVKEAISREVGAMTGGLNMAGFPGIQ